VINQPRYIPHRWTYEDLRDVLLPQRQCLEALTIDLAYEGRRHHEVILSDFTALQTLHLYSFEFPDNVEQTCSHMFSAPQLRYFKLLFPLYEQSNGYRLTLDHFNDGPSEWVRQVANIIHLRGYSLRSIFIEFNPPLSSGFDSRGFHHNRLVFLGRARYPWDLLDKLALEIRKKDIALTYQNPCISRETFEKYVESQIDEEIINPNFNAVLFRFLDEVCHSWARQTPI
jgi:hypothetical protein